MREYTEPVFDLEQMKKAMKGPFYRIPAHYTPEQIVELLTVNTLEDNLRSGVIKCVWVDEIDEDCPYYITSLLEKEQLPSFMNKMYCEYYFDMDDKMALMFYFELVNSFNSKDIKILNDYKNKIINKYTRNTNLWIYNKIIRQEK